MYETATNSELTRSLYRVLEEFIEKKSSQRPVNFTFMCSRSNDTIEYRHANPSTKQSVNEAKTSFIDVRIKKGQKPLEKKSFYLDIKNHAIATKLEAKIKELGGVSCISYLLRILCGRLCIRVSRFVSRLSICQSVLVYFG